MLDQVHSLADELQIFFQQEARRKLSRTKALEFCAKAYGFPTYNHVPKQATAEPNRVSINVPPVGETAAGAPTVLNTSNGPATLSAAFAADSSSFFSRLFSRLQGLSTTEGVHNIPLKFGSRLIYLKFMVDRDVDFVGYTLQFWETVNGPMFYGDEETSSLRDRDVVEFLRKGALAAMDIWGEASTLTSFKLSLLEVIQSPELSLSPEYHVGLRLANRSFEFVE